VRLISLLLKPLSLVYELVLKLRHRLYDRGFFTSRSFDFPIIVIGNLSLGGSGKTPMTIYLVDYFSAKIPTVILSRGYGRKSKGFLEVILDKQVEKYGDEPCLIKSKSEKTRNFVGEDRSEAIKQIHDLIPEKKIVILDDAFQHRKLKAGLNILLTDYYNLYTEDELIPSGKLRDIKERSTVVDLIIVTKSPDIIPQSELKSRLDSIKKYSSAPIIFSSLFYQNPINFFTRKETKINEKIIVVTALANSKPFLDFLKGNNHIVCHNKFKDHYQFSIENVNKWIEYMGEYEFTQIVTTEKDAVKLGKFQDLFEKENIELIVIPIQMHFEEADEIILRKIIDKAL
jgi:tetraacyldisaccharide 4'-kinase